MGADTSLVSSAFDTLDAAGVRWAALRDAPLDPSTPDIDLLVHRDDVDRLDDALARVGLDRLETWRDGDHRFFFAYDEAGDRWIKLDVVGHLVYRAGRELPASAVDAVLVRRVHVGGTWRLAPDDEFWALVLHCLLDRGSVAPRHLRRLATLACNEPVGPLRDAIGQPELTSRVVELARDADGARLAALREPIQANLSRPPWPRRTVVALRAASAPVLKALRRPGVNVVILGPDGAGKSTLVKSLSGRLPVGVRTYYAGLYGGRLESARHGRVPGVALARQLMVTWRAYLSAAYQRRRGRITVFDRYGYDALLDSPSATAGTKRRLRRSLLGRLVPRPDLVIVLDAPATRLHRRKSEHDLADVERRRTDYHRLARRLRRHVPTEIVDTTTDPTAVRRRATRLIWNAFTRRG